MERLVRFLQKLFSEKFYGCVIIKFENSKATHIEMTSAKSNATGGVAVGSHPLKASS